MIHPARALTAAFLALLLFSLVPHGDAYAQTNVSPTAVREITINVRLVLMGIDRGSVLEDYLLWNAPQRRYQLISIPGISTQVRYQLRYETAYASEGSLRAFTSYLNSIGTKERRTNVLWNETIFNVDGNQFLNYTHFRVDAINLHFPADEVERWLFDHADDLGGFPKNSYTLVLADLSKMIQSFSPDQYFRMLRAERVEISPHFYSKVYVDSDLGIEIRRNFMTSWGGHGRAYFIDLSAGPTHAAEQLPIQVALALNRINLGSNYGKTWLTQYIADYVEGVVYNLFTPDFVYPINFAEAYRISLFVVDNRSRGSKPDIGTTLNLQEIQTWIERLLPVSKIEVRASFIHASERAALQNLLLASTAAARPSRGDRVVDARPIYNWLSESGAGNIRQFLEVKRDRKVFDIPVFVFAFEDDFNLGFTFKEAIADHEFFDRAIWGVALYEFALVSHSAKDLLRGDFSTQKQPGKGFGFTNTIIHEVGHMFGLMHPFATNFDPTENFVASVMAYYPYEYQFSSFDTDALLRGYADALIQRTHELISSTPLSTLFSVQRTSALDQAEKYYAMMNYRAAVEAASKAELAASKTGIWRVLFPERVVVIGAVAFALIFGILVGYLIGRARRRPSF